MKSSAVFFAIVIFINLINASCEEGQINVNTATEKELEKLYGIGPVKAEAIIDARPLDSLEDLINVNGIGEITLGKIKEQNLACVEEDAKEDDKEITEKNIEEDYSFTEEEIVHEVYAEAIPIKLNPYTKDIKSEDDGNLNRKSYAIYGMFGFCILLAFLFAFKKLKSKRYKNEFE